MNHEAITAIVTDNGRVPYGVGITPNPFASQCAEWKRRHEYAADIKVITDRIAAIFEPRFITPPETSAFIEALITMTDARSILEVGTHTGFTTLHMLRAVIGKSGAKVTSIDARPAHDQSFWNKYTGWIEFIQGWTPDAFSRLDRKFDLVFVDSDHSVEHTEKEMHALWRLTHVGSIFLFHDCPEWQTPTNRTPPPIRTWLLNNTNLRGLILPTAEQLDCLDAWGAGYPKQCNPHLGIFIRQ